MATGADVLNMLRPEQGWGIYGDDFDSIWYDEGVIPLTKEEFEEGFAKADDYFAAIAAEKEKARKEVLNKLGLTEEEINLLIK